MSTLATDKLAPDSKPALAAMLEGFDCPAILVSANYEILATNRDYTEAFGSIDLTRTHHCFQVSHGYSVPCDQAGEDCPLAAAQRSGHRERVLHIHQTPKGREHVDVEMLPIHGNDGKLLYFVELLRPVPLASGEIEDQEMVGESPAFQKMLTRVARVGKTPASVLLLGESGTGKELAARAIHMASERKDNPLVTLECAGLTDSLFETELFGHVKGAFTGAQAAKKGLVEHADGGTLFLDEVGDIPLSMQVKLLRLIETGSYRQVGSTEVRRADFRLICATHKNLDQMVQHGEFRSDLFFRINVFPIHLPALSERREDIPLLVEAMLKRLDPDQQFRITKSAIILLQQHNYRGNIRELRNLLNRAIVLADTSLIDEKIVSEALDDGTMTIVSAANPPETDWVDLKTNEQRYIQRLLTAQDGDKERVAEILGISTRSLYRKLDSANG
jgi:DNA-binding NtrC family response regulator